jgi:hypothetical protein
MKRKNAKLKSGTKRKRIGKFKAACLAAGLSTAWAAEADAEILYRASITPERTIHNAVIYYLSGVTTHQQFFPLGLLPANQTTVAYHSIPPNIYGEEVTGYALAGWYEGDDGPGVTVSFPTSMPISTGMTWEEVFSTSVPFSPPTTYSEASILSILQDDRIPYGFFYSYNSYFSQTERRDFPYLVTEFNHESTLINFSTAEFGGTAIVEAVPEPSTFVMFVFAAGGLLVVASKRVC